MVLAGMGLALLPGMPDLRLDPDLTLVLFLPPLLFSSAYFTVWRDFKANLRVILQLAVGAVVFTTCVVGVVTHWLVPTLPWAACFALGAIVSPPDAVAAKAVLQGLALPPRLITLLEGESLINDAAGLVLFRFAIAAGLTGTFSVWAGAAQFGILSVGGITVGVAFGSAASRLLGLLREPHLNILGAFLTAWAAYLLGERLHVSGVLVTVAPGLVLGWRQHEVFGALTRVQAHAVWSVVVFVLESLIFILIGLALRGVIERLSAAGLATEALATAVAWIVVALIVARFAWILPSTYLTRFLSPALRRRDPYPSLAVPIAISWAGMLGVVSLAVVLSVPESFPGRDFMTVTTMAVILVSILVQGTTLKPLIRALKLQGFVLERQPTLSEAEARALMVAAEATAVAELSRQPDGTDRHARLVEQYRHRSAMATRYVEATGGLESDRRQHFAAVMIANSAGRRKVLALHRAGDIHDTVLHALEAELDFEEVGARRVLDDCASTATHRNAACPSGTAEPNAKLPSDDLTTGTETSKTWRQSSIDSARVRPRSVEDVLSEVPLKAYVLSLAAGGLVGIVYGLLGVAAPAPPVVALVGLLGILLGEQFLPVGRRLLGGRGLWDACSEAGTKFHLFGELPGRHVRPLTRTDAPTLELQP